MVRHPTKNMVYICGLIVILEMFDLSFVNSTLGVIKTSFNVSLAQVKLIYTSFAIGAAMVLPLTKWLYSVCSLKKMLVLVVLGLWLSFLTSYYTSSFYLFCFFRGIQGILITAGYSLIYTQLIEYSQDKSQDINFINGVSILGLMVGPIFAGFVANINWRLFFMVLLLISALIFALIFTVSWQTNQSSSKVKITLLDLSEYLGVFLILLCLSLLFEQELFVNRIYYILSLVILLSAIVLLCGIYHIFQNNFVFEHRVFNYQFSKAVGYNFLVRCSLALVPLFTLILQQQFKLSVLPISFLLSFSAVAAIIAKLTFNRYQNTALFKHADIVMMLCFILWVFIFNYYSTYWLYLFYGTYGFLSSILYNQCNLGIYNRQPAALHNSLSLALTIIQVISYGICVALVFTIFKLFSAMTSLQLAITITLIILSVLLVLGKLLKMWSA